MPSSYSGDPYWLVARFAGKCAGCDRPFAKGSDVFWYPRARKGYAGRDVCECGEDAARDFRSSVADEDFYNYA